MLPHVPLEQPLLDTMLPEFPHVALAELVGFVNAAHATDLEKQWSITGWVFCYAVAAIANKSKFQTVIDTSSTEAKFVAAVHAAKTARYLCSVLKYLGFCDPMWCHFRDDLFCKSTDIVRAKLRNVNVNPANKIVYDEVKNLQCLFTTHENLLMLLHPFDSQNNEALNQGFAKQSL